MTNEERRLRNISETCDINFAFALKLGKYNRRQLFSTQ